MKPRTKIQKEVFELSKSLPPITERKKAWGIEKCFTRFAYQTKKETICFECGHEWETIKKVKRCTCPKCGTKLMVRDDNKRKVHEAAYYAVVTTSGGYQVVQMLLIWQNLRVREHARYTVNEVYQQWISSEAKVVINSIGVNGMGGACDQWIWGSEMTIKSDQDNFRYKLSPYKVYPQVKSLDIFKRNGFKGSFYHVSPRALFVKIITEPIAETLLKSNQFALLSEYCCSSGYGYSVRKRWQQVKICIRNKYIVKDAKIWLDHIDLLEKYKKDINNAKFICPDDIKLDHKFYIDKERKIRERKQMEQNKLNAEKRRAEAEKMKSKLDSLEAKYKDEKGKFFGVQFVDKGLKVCVLGSVLEFIQEADSLGHCVYSNAYYSKPESLILSAKMRGKRLETVEVNLNEFRVSQCHGEHNQNSRHHKRIVALVSRNMKAIRKVASPA